MPRYIFCILLALSIAEAFPKGKSPLAKFPKSKATCTTAQIQTVSTAYTKLFASYGLPPSAPYMNYTQSYSNKIFMGGYNGQVDVCKWQTQLVSDLKGIDSDNACMNAATLSMALGVPTDDGFNYMVDYRKMSYECGEGYQALMNNFYCLRAIGLYDPEPQKCDAALVNTCPSMNDYITCYRGVYQSNCGSETAKWICNVLVVDFNASAPQCASSLQAC